LEKNRRASDSRSRTDDFSRFHAGRLSRSTAEAIDSHERESKSPADREM
jgi:hypothetical protein